jgi:MmoB/DmpM family
VPDEPNLSVGPVLEASETGRALVAAILNSNPGARVEDRGAYLRISCQRRCLLTVEAAERELGRRFNLPVDIEAVMPAFKGLITISDGYVEWSLESQ